MNCKNCKWAEYICYTSNLSSKIRCTITDKFCNPDTECDVEVRLNIHANWNYDSKLGFVCSNCNYQQYNISNFCSNCGARMNTLNSVTVK